MIGANRTDILFINIKHALFVHRYVICIYVRSILICPYINIAESDMAGLDRAGLCDATYARMLGLEVHMQGASRQ